MTKPIAYHQKTISSGSVIEQTTYERLVSHGFKISSSWKEKRKLAKTQALANLTQEQILERRIKNRKLSMLRSKNTLTRLINANVYQYFNTKGRAYPPIFLTLTFVEDIRTQKQANKLFMLFIKRLNYKIHKNKSYTLKYSVVVEFQDLNREGVIHYHVLLYDLPFIHVLVLYKIWRKGGIKINEIKHINDTAEYVTKYMQKNFQDARLDGHKRHFSSRGLYKPKVYAGTVAFEIIKNAIPKDTPTWSISFETEKKGKIIKTTSTLNNKKVLRDIIDIEKIQEIEKYDIS